MERMTDESRMYLDFEFMEDGIAPYFNKLREYEDAEFFGEIVKVVRCRDCKHWTKAVIGRGYGGHPCGKIHGTTEIKQGHEYCNLGERVTT